MIYPETYEALAPALLRMFQLGQQASGIRVRHLLSLYPEKLEEGLKLYLILQAEQPEAVEAYMETHRIELIELGTHVTLDEDLRGNLGAALGIAIHALSRGPLHGRYLSTLNGLNKKPMYSRLLLMLTLLCAYLPELNQKEGFQVGKELDLLLRNSAGHLTHLMKLATELDS